MGAKPITRRRVPTPTNDPKPKGILKPSIQLQKGKDRAIDGNPKTLKASVKDNAKEQAKLQRDINKLVTDRRDTLKDFTIELSRAFESYSFVESLKQKFRRQHIARYDNKSKEWVPTTPHATLEELYVLFLSADTLVLVLLQEGVTEMLASLRRTYHLTTRSQIFIMVDGLDGYYKRKKGLHVEGAEDTAQWLFNITGDLGIRPHKRIQESFLPFCTNTRVKCGSSKMDTYKKMLQQIRNITESAADGIIGEAPTLRELFEGYAQEPDVDNRHDRLKEVIVSNKKDGTAKSRILNQALSKKVHDVFWGDDPLVLV
ncbi:unnamed protein product [Rhizoctonia solani]|uniref:ERCC4 domain-containing protein n=1 Tax=Rhizoctonia solani TaxID=456999 RepID=A0A8H3HMZ8_9AGAM|nr:unnamed protein product [Rhizoctonia solani]